MKKESSEPSSSVKTDGNHPSCTEFISVPSFPLKAYDIVSDPAYKDIVKWTKEGDAFIITNKNEFSDQVLPKYFKHKNLATFVRQLNIYGFKKTKYKNEDHCFAHKDFQKDNKRLLLNIKRKVTKSKNSDRKSYKEESPYMPRDEIIALFQEANQKISDQSRQIEKLIQANTEFKNSVMALYTQLEKSKERELQLEKVILENQYKMQNGPQPIFDENLCEMFKDHASDHPLRNIRDLIKNEDCEQLFKKYTEQLNNQYKNQLNLFTSFISNFMQHLKGKDKIFYEKPTSKLQYVSKPSNKNMGNELIPYDSKNHMIENGPLESMGSERSFRVESLLRSPGNKREKKALKHQNSVENEMWDKICEVKSVNGSQDGGLLNNIPQNMKEKNPYIDSLDNHSFSGLENQKEQSEDDVSSISVGSHKKLNDISSFSSLQNHSFE